MADVIPSTVVRSAPFGGGIIEPLKLMIPILTTEPSKMPEIMAKIILTVGCICLFLKLIE
jgi:hypothetical protein